MSIESSIAREVAVHFEAKKTGFVQAQDGWSLTLRIQDNDVPASVRDSRKGTRYMVALVELNDDETPKVTGQTTEKASLGQAAPVKAHTPSPAPSKRWDDLSYAQRAGMLCQDSDFWLFARVTSLTAADHVRRVCGVNSRSEIDGNYDAMKAFDVLYNTFDHWRKYERNAA